MEVAIEAADCHQCSQLVTKNTVHHKACALSRKPLCALPTELHGWIRLKKFNWNNWISYLVLQIEIKELKILRPTYFLFSFAWMRRKKGNAENLSSQKTFFSFGLLVSWDWACDSWCVRVLLGVRMGGWVGARVFVSVRLCVCVLTWCVCASVNVCLKYCSIRSQSLAPGCFQLVWLKNPAQLPLVPSCAELSRLIKLSNIGFWKRSYLILHKTH